MKDLGPFTVLKFGNFQAIKNGSNVIVANKDGKYQIMEIKDFRKFWKENVPDISGQPDTDTFEKSTTV